MQVNNALSNTDKLTAQLNEVKACNESTTKSLAEKDRIIQNLNNELNVTQARSQKLSIDLNKADNNLKQAKLNMGNLKKEVVELKNSKKSELNLTDIDKGKCS